MLKADAWPLSREVPHWQPEAMRCRFEANDRYAPSMWQRVNLARIYTQAARLMPGTTDGQQPLPLPDPCPETLDELLSDD